MTMIRKAVVAGQFYAGNNENLKQQIEDCFLGQRGPGAVPKISYGSKDIEGLVVPHAGYIYSGAIAAHSYYHLAQNGFADTFVILGPNHTGAGSGVSVMTEGIWETPLGPLSINKLLAEQIWTGIIDKDNNAHQHEHSIEVQLPFLQFTSQKFDFVPICMAMQDYKTSQEVGNILADAIKKSKKSVVIIASSDFSHAGFNYMSVPPSGMQIYEYAEKQDRLAIDQIIQMDAEGLISTVHKNNITMCGYGPVAAMLIAAEQLDAQHVELLKYGTSYEVHPGDSCVGYGALAIY